jgi:hypothetical protein
MAVQDAMAEVWEMWKGKPGFRGCDDIMDSVLREKATLRKEVEKYCQERGV